jgi:hypothetical protein
MVRESDFAMTGTTLTTSESFFKTTISMGLRLFTTISGEEAKATSGIRVTRRLDEKQATVDTCILNIAFTLGGKFLSKVRRVLVLNVFHNRIPAPVIVYLVSVTWGIDNIESESDAILFDD